MLWLFPFSRLTEGVDEGEKNKNVEKPSNDEELTDANKENPATDTVEKKPEDKVKVSYIDACQHVSSLVCAVIFFYSDF